MPTIDHKSPWDSCAILQIISVLLLKFEKCAAFLLLFPFPIKYNVENQEKVQVVDFSIVWGGGPRGEVRQVKLYSRLACAQKHQKCKFVPRL